MEYQDRQDPEGTHQPLHPPVHEEYFLTLLIFGCPCLTISVDSQFSLEVRFQSLQVLHSTPLSANMPY